MFCLCSNSERTEIVEYSSEVKPTITYFGGEWTMVGRGYNTIEELYEGDKILQEPCVVCNRLIKSNYNNREQLVRKNMCFSCDLWDERAKMINNPKIAICDGEFYSIGNENPNSYPRGHAGRKFIIHFFNGKVIETTNLWYGGKIPKEWISALPNNACFSNE